MASVLVIEDDPQARNALLRVLAQAEHQASAVGSAEEGVEALGAGLFDVVVCDLQLPGMSGLDLLATLRGDDHPPVIVVTGSADVATAVAAMRAGAADYVTKPLTFKALQHVLDRVVEVARLRRHVDRLEREAAVDPDPWSTARSAAMQSTLHLAQRAAEHGASPVLLVGESGVGKEVVASFLHRSSPRAKGAFVRINVAAIPDAMLEAELFGATRGAYTDARRDRQGFFAAAQGGTLLLDELAEMRLELQAKLLRAIETRRYYPVGASREVVADVRILAATNRDPIEAVTDKRLRADLYYRLATLVITVPPLRERREDIAPIARSIVAQLRRQTGRGPRELSPDALAALEAYTWPGNVRELRNALERVSILTDVPIATAHDLERCAIFGAASLGVPTPVATRSTRRTPLPHGVPRRLETVTRNAVEEAERRHIATVLMQSGGNRGKAAAALGISRSTLWAKLRLYGLEDEGGRRRRSDRDA